MPAFTCLYKRLGLQHNWNMRANVPQNASQVSGSVHATYPWVVPTGQDQRMHPPHHPHTFSPGTLQARWSACLSKSLTESLSESHTTHGGKQLPAAGQTCGAAFLKTGGTCRWRRLGRARTASGTGLSSQ